MIARFPLKEVLKPGNLSGFLFFRFGFVKDNINFWLLKNKLLLIFYKKENKNNDD